MYKYSIKKKFNIKNILQNFSKNSLKKIYHDILRIRLIEEAIESKYHEDEMKTPIHLVIGQEATSVGVCYNLKKTDIVFSSHRTHGNYLAKNGDLKSMLSEFFCKETGTNNSRTGSMHLLDQKVGYGGSSAIVGGIIPIAAGHALRNKMMKKNQIVVCFIGDATLEEGVTWETFNFSALKKLPIIFVCENNFYSVCTPLSVRQSNENLIEKVKSFSLKTFLVDGTNVIDVIQKTKLALDLIKKNKGPVFIESQAYRLRAHGGAGDDTKTGYRSTKEYNQWNNNCPLIKYEKLLKYNKIIDDNFIKNRKKIINNEISHAFDFAKKSKTPKANSIYNYVYSK